MEEAVLDALRDRLMQDDMVAAFIAAFREAVRTDGQERTAEQRRIEAELRKVRQDLDGLDATARQGRLTDRLHRLMVELEAKVEALEAALASPSPPPVPLPDDLVALLSLGLGANTPKAGAAGASGLRERVCSVMVVAGARNHLDLLISAELGLNRKAGSVNR